MKTKYYKNLASCGTGYYYRVTKKSNGYSECLKVCTMEDDIEISYHANSLRDYKIEEGMTPSTKKEFLEQYINTSTLLTNKL